MFVAVHLPVLLEHTVLGTSAHEVEVTLAGGNKAAHSGSRLPTTITALKNEGRNNHHLKLYQNAFHMPAQTSSYLKRLHLFPVYILPGGALLRRHCAPAEERCFPHTPLQTKGSS